MTLEKQLNELFEKASTSFEEASNEQYYYALLSVLKQRLADTSIIQGKKKLYYISAEFLIGKLLSNNLINLNLYDEAKTLLESHGRSLAEIEEIEPEPSLGNGGLGRLAACFLDSIATLGLAGDGIGLCYHFGLFKQQFVNHQQKEEINPWIEKDSWLRERDVTFTVPFGGFSLDSKLYDIDVVGYENGKNQLHLFDIQKVDESIVHDGIDFDKGNLLRNLTLFLYPDDSDEAGRMLRIYQQYFMVSNGAQYILMNAKKEGLDLHKLNEFVTIQINDTHPTLVIPELIRLLMLEGIDLDEAIAITSKTCAYTNHTILAEALETWPRRFLEEAVPHLMPIIEALDQRVKAHYDNPSVAIIDDADLVHMAHIDIHYGYSVNGVAAIHTEILKNTELKPFYQIYPEKFNNKTNGITFRRWLYACNPELDQWLNQWIGSDYKKDAAKLEQLLAFKDNKQCLDELAAIKQLKKKQLAQMLKATQNIDLDPESVFCIQIKRLHEYKRQQMNALYIIHKYFEIKAGKLPARPITMIFGAKAAPAYIIAKDIIHLILCLSEFIAKDPDVAPYLKVVMVENYNVTLAEKLIPACDISEQISLASKEASGTGNMKFMLNGAVTLGTADGANVEIAELVGEQNIYTFGESSEQVIAHYQNHDYISKKIYKQEPHIKQCVDFIVSKELCSIGSRKILRQLQQELINKDWFMTLLDLNAYIAEKDRCLADYEKHEEWTKKMLVNIAKAGFFSSDRTIAQYNQDIWKL
ncbi:glycogen/starch/alpha-glucan phosphorylase [Dielma fastidiosa]|uniref:Alpha-1,4 glucan phosphorylase n=1 Tax=Dielma fastidiosa TaxID=1034346 RepID=A0A318KPJ7_9FIRM|nr:glycogen/starch/alpha-glucan phosphorylase [Dielma fastidiosa]PXX79689.1 starch phosphorylase [Dielma fastidiosa]